MKFMQLETRTRLPPVTGPGTLTITLTNANIVLKLVGIKTVFSSTG
jgi:hypothetical protein